AEVTHPLRVPAWRDEIARAVECQRVDGRSTRCSRLTAADLENARAPEADAGAGQASDDAVEDVSGEPVGSLVVQVRVHGSDATPPACPFSSSRIATGSRRSWHSSSSLKALESQSPSNPGSQTCALLLAQCHSLTNLT